MSNEFMNKTNTFYIRYKYEK